ncbi:MAG: hypothetical protein ACRD0P_05125 [Stackebrandtia sp.]
MKRYVIPLTGLVVVFGTAWFAGVLPWSPGDSDALELNGSSRHYTVTVSLDPPATGQLDAHVNAEAPPGGSVTKVSVAASMPEMGHATPELPAKAEDDGHFTVHGELFTMRGAWELSVLVDGSSGTETITLEVQVDQ